MIEGGDSLSCLNGAALGTCGIKDESVERQGLRGPRVLGILRCSRIAGAIVDKTRGLQPKSQSTLP